MKAPSGIFIWEFLKLHWTALLLSVLVGGLFLLPYILTPLFFTPKGYKFTTIPSGDPGIYAAQIRQVYQGNFFPTDSQIIEYRDSPPLFQILGPTVFGSLARLIGDFELIFPVEAFMVGFFVSIISYFLMYEMLKLKSLAIFSSLAFVTGYPLFITLTSTSVFNLPKLISIFLLKSLPVNPMISSLPLSPFHTLIVLAAFFFTIKSLSAGKYSWIWAGVFAGALFYTTVYYWSLFFSGLMVFFLILVFKKDGKNLKTILKISTLSLVLSLPYWLLYLQNSQLDTFKILGQFQARYLEYFFSLRYIFFAALFFLLAFKKPNPKELLLISFLLGGVICLNFQILLGFTVNPNHWPPRVEIFLMIFCLYFVFKFVKEKNILKTIQFRYLNILTALLILYLTIFQIKYARGGMHDNIVNQKRSELDSWIENSLGSKSILGLDSDFIYTLVSRTGAKVYIPYGGYTSASISELEDRLIIAYSLYGVDKDKFASEFDRSGWLGAHYVALYDFHKYYHLDPGQYPKEVFKKITLTDPVRSWYIRYLPLSKREDLLSKYSQIEMTGLKEKVNRYHLDYLIVSSYERSLADVDERVKEFSSKVFDNGDYAVYQVEKDKII